MGRRHDGAIQLLPDLSPGYARVIGSAIGGNIAAPDYIANASSHAATTTGSMTLGNLRAMPFVAPARGGVLARIAAEVTGASAGNNIRLGLYRNVVNPRSIYPGALLQDSGDISSTLIGIKAHSIAQALEPGVVYWLVLNTSANITMRALRVNEVSHFLGMEAAATTALNMGIIVASAYGALPDPFPGGGAFITAIPIPLLTYQFSG